MLGHEEQEVLKINDTFYCWYRKNDATLGSCIALMHSLDGVSGWIEDGIIFTKSPSGWDSDEVIAPSVYFDGTTYYLYYEAADSANPGHRAIGVATAPSPRGPYSRRSTPLLKPDAAWEGWTTGNFGIVGTPAIMKGANGTFYLFYHGFHNGSDRVGVAYSSSPTGPFSKEPNNPVLDIGAVGEWDDNKVAPSSAYMDGASNVMLFYEGFNGIQQPVINWQIGIADGIIDSVDGRIRSLNRRASNPVIPLGAPGSFDSVTAQLPSALRVNDQMWVYYSGNNGSAFRLGRAVAQIGTVTPPPPPPPTTGTIKHLFYIVLENESVTAVNGSSAPYLMSVVKSKGVNLTNFWAATSPAKWKGGSSAVHPSLPNYLAMISGSEFGIRDDAGPGSHTSIAGNSTIVRLLKSKGVSWKGYMESMSSPCAKSNTGSYAVRHDPFVYFSDVTGDSAYCASHVVNLSQLTTDIANNAVPKYCFITPNVNSDGHDTSVSYSDNWLKGFLPKLLAIPDSVIVVTYDEDSSNHIFTAMIDTTGGKLLKVGTSVATLYDVYCMLATIEKIFGLGNLGRSDMNAPIISAPFQTGVLDGTVTPPPQDTIPPALTITQPQMGSTLTTSFPVIRGTVNDNVGVSTVRVSIDNNPHVSATIVGTNWSYSVPSLSNGTHTAYAYASDTSTNISPTANVTFMIDATPPTIQITSPTGGQTLGGIDGTLTFVMTGTALDDQSGVAHVEFSIDGGAFRLASGQATWTTQVTLTKGGNHTITVRATDVAGNSATRTMNLTQNMTYTVG